MLLGSVEIRKQVNNAKTVHARALHFKKSRQTLSKTKVFQLARKFLPLSADQNQPHNDKRRT